MLATALRAPHTQSQNGREEGEEGEEIETGAGCSGGGGWEEGEG